MGFIGGHEDSGEGVRIPLPALPRAPALDISADEAVALPALLIDGLIIFLLGAFTGTTYQVLAFGGYGSPSIYAGTGLIVAAVFCGATRVMSSTHPVGASRNIGRARTALTAWIGPEIHRCSHDETARPNARLARSTAPRMSR